MTREKIYYACFLGFYVCFQNSHVMYSTVFFYSFPTLAVGLMLVFALTPDWLIAFLHRQLQKHERTGTSFLY